MRQGVEPALPRRRTFAVREVRSVPSPDLIFSTPAKRLVHRRHAWRLVLAAPAVLVSALIVIVLFGWSARWQAGALLGSLLTAAALMTRPGERAALHAVAGFADRPGRNGPWSGQPG